MSPARVHDAHGHARVAGGREQPVELLDVVEDDQGVERAEQLGPLEARVGREHHGHRAGALDGVPERGRRHDGRPVVPRSPCRRRDARVDADDGTGHRIDASRARVGTAISPFYTG